MSKPLAIVSILLCALTFTTSVSGAGLTEEAVRTQIAALAQALSDLPKTGDVASVLKFYAPDYVGIVDGEWQTRDDLQQGYAEIVGHPKDTPVSLSYRVSNIQAHTIHHLVWVTYAYAVQTGVSG